jgi:cell division protease FtsH
VYYGDEPIARRGLEIPGAKEFAETTAEAIDAEVKRIIDEAYADARRMIDQNRDKLQGLAQALLKYETLDGDEVRRVIAGDALDKPTVADLIAAEQEGRRTTTAPAPARPAQRPPDEQAGPLPSPA